MWESVPPLQASLIASQRVSSLHTVRCRQTRQSATLRYVAGCVRSPRVLPASLLSRTPPRMVGHTMSVLRRSLRLIMWRRLPGGRVVRMARGGC